MAAKLCKEQQISFGNNTKYSDFIDGKYIVVWTKTAKGYFKNVEQQGQQVIRRQSKVLEQFIVLLKLKSTF